MAKNFNKHLEILLFVGNNESYKYGKGWGEGKIIEYVFKNSKVLHKGDVVTILIGMPHQLYAIEEGEIIEVSTQHFDSDSYRIYKGD